MARPPGWPPATLRAPITAIDLDIDRAGQRRLEAARTAGVIDAGTRLGRDGGDALRHNPQRRFRIRGQPGRLALAPDERAERAVRLRDPVEPAVEERVGDARLSLHPIGERHVGGGGRADVEDEVRLALQHLLEIGRAAAAGQAAELRPGADLGEEEGALFGTIGARPAEQEVGGQRVEHDRCRRAGRKHPLDAARHGHAASRGVGDGLLGAGSEGPGGARHPGQNAAAAEHRYPSIPIMTSEALTTA